MKHMLAAINSTNGLRVLHSILTNRTRLSDLTSSESRSSVHLLICRNHWDIGKILIKSHCE